MGRGDHRDRAGGDRAGGAGPARAVGDEGAGHHANLYGIRVAAEDDVLLVKVRSRRAGRTASTGAATARSSSGAAGPAPRARRALTCKVRLRGRRPERVRLVITLRVKGKLLDVRRASLRHLRARHRALIGRLLACSRRNLRRPPGIAK